MYDVGSPGRGTLWGLRVLIALDGIRYPTYLVLDALNDLSESLQAGVNVSDAPQPAWL